MSKRMAKFTINDSQLYLIAFIVGMICGVVLFKVKNDMIYPSMCLYQELRTDKLRRMDSVSASLMGYVATERLKEFGLLFLTQLTFLRRIIACAYCTICGIACAVLEAFYVQEYELKGIVVFAATLLPQYIFYVMAWYKLCTSDLNVKQINRETVVKIVGIFLLALVFMFVGIICESVFNVWCMKKFF